MNLQLPTLERQDLSVPLPDKTLKQVAAELYRQLKNQGVEARQIVSFSTHLLGNVEAELAKRPLS